MPFQSEAQRRYLWANEPEIARDWTDTYGSRIQAANGGGMDWAGQGGMKNYLGEQPMVNAPQNWRSGPDSPPTELAYITDAEKDLILRSNMHGSLTNGPNEGPSGIMSLDSQGDYTPDRSPTAKEGTLAPGVGGGHSNYMNQQIQQAHDQKMKDFYTGNLSQKDPMMHETIGSGQSNKFNPLKFIGGMFGDPGRILSGVMGIKDNLFQGRGDYPNQAAWEKAKKDRITQKRVDNMLSRRGLGKDYGEQNLYDLSKGKYDFRDDQFGKNRAGITGVDAVEDFDVKDVFDVTKVDDTFDDTFDDTTDNIDWENEYDFTDKRLPSSHPDYWKKQDMDYGVRDLRDFKEWDEWNKGYWEKDTREIPSHPDYKWKQDKDYGYISNYEDPNDPFHRKRESDYGRYSDWIDEENPIKNYYPLEGNKQELENIDINEDVPSATDLFNKRFVNIKDMSVLQIKEFNALDRRDKMEKSGIEIPDPLNDEEKQRLENLRKLRESKVINEPKSYIV